MRKLLAILSFTIISVFFIQHTIAMKLVAPICYRLDLSMAPVLMMSVYFGKGDRRVWYVFIMKEMLTLILGNPGISFVTYTLLTLSNMVMDIIMLICYKKMKLRGENRYFLHGLLSVGIYAAACTVLNAAYHAALSAYAYDSSISRLVEIAAIYNSKAAGFFSFLIWCVTPFYILKFLSVMMVTSLLTKIYMREDY